MQCPTSSDPAIFKEGSRFIDKALRFYACAVYRSVKKARGAFSTRTGYAALEKGESTLTIVTGSVPVGVYHHLKYPGERLHVLGYSLYTFVISCALSLLATSLLHDLKLELIACSIL